MLGLKSMLDFNKAEIVKMNKRAFEALLQVIKVKKKKKKKMKNHIYSLNYFYLMYISALIIPSKNC
jgi:hypothetical protein